VQLVDRATLRLRRARAFAVMLWRAGRWKAVEVGVLTLVRGLVPTAIILVTGVLVDAVPDAVRLGLGSPDGLRAQWALAAVALAFLANGIGDALATYAARAVGSRYAITVHDTVAGATASPGGIAALEDPAIAAELAAIEEYDRAGIYRDAVLRLGEFASPRIQGAAAFVILLGFRWWAPLVVLAGWRLVNSSVARWVEKGVARGHVQSGTGLRRAQYYRSLAVEAPAAKEVRIFGLGDWVVDQYASTWQTAMTGIWRGRKASLPGVLVTAAGLAVANGIVVGALGWAALGGKISLGALVIFGQAVLAAALLGPLGDSQWQASRILHGAQKVLELEARLADGHPPPIPAEASQGTSGRPVAVRLAGVRFTYRGRTEPTLAALDLTIPAGQSLAIVGENGVGKTTLIKLLCGLYEPDAGRILIDGAHEPLRARNRIAVIFQEFVRYELPLRANVGFGSLTLAEDTGQLETALRDAGGAELPTIPPAGWDTVLARGYDKGADLSGGQWQKVALARALTAVRGGAGLLILDEPTANLDVRAETELFDRFIEITRDITTILVSHRLSSVRRADRIVVIADGRIAEDGTHEELLRRGGRYAAMYTLQAERFAAASSLPVDAPGREVGIVA
jgi:ATP-binding cassette, subfamily B, bacterial